MLGREEKIHIKCFNIIRIEIIFPLINNLGGHHGGTPEREGITSLIIQQPIIYLIIFFNIH